MNRRFDESVSGLADCRLSFLSAVPVPDHSLRPDAPGSSGGWSRGKCEPTGLGVKAQEGNENNGRPASLFCGTPAAADSKSKLGSVRTTVRVRSVGRDPGKSQRRAIEPNRRYRFDSLISPSKKPANAGLTSYPVLLRTGNQFIAQPVVLKRSPLSPPEGTRLGDSFFCLRPRRIISRECEWVGCSFPIVALRPPAPQTTARATN